MDLAVVSLAEMPGHVMLLGDGFLTLWGSPGVVVALGSWLGFSACFRSVTSGFLRIFSRAWPGLKTLCPDQRPACRHFELSQTNKVAQIIRRMLLAAINKPKQLLYLSFIARVDVQQLVQSWDEMVLMIADLKPGFRVLTDLSRLDSIGADCGPEIGRTMELCDQNGVSLIVRVVPDPTKDIGLNILSRFHYAHRPRMVTCQSMAEAAKLLSL